MSGRPLRVLIADDEPLALERLRVAFGDIADTEVVGAAANGVEALQLIAELKPDVAVLDIQMPGRTGLGVAAALPADDRPEIIFLTAYDSHALDAFDVEAADYVLKPLRLERLRQAVDRARRRRRATPDPTSEMVTPGAAGNGFWVQGRRGPVLVPLAAIAWIEAAKDYVLLHTAERSHILRATMAAIEASHPPPTLVRVHRSALVRPGAVKALQGSGAGRPTLVLADGAPVAVGPSYLPEVARMFGR
jgi:DNA-binding LytR/AlgR family response regulator